MAVLSLSVTPRVVRRLTATLFAGQSLSTLGLSGATTIGSIAITQLAGSAALAGVPTTLYVLGTALGAYPAGRLMERYGRRFGLVLGFLIGIIGAGLGASALLGLGPWLLLLAHGVMGLGRGTLDQSRFAAADMVDSAARARAVSWVVLGGTAGGIGGPLLIGPASRLVAGLGLEPLAGPYLACALLFFFGALAFAMLLRPDPRDIAHALFAQEAHPTTPGFSAASAPRTFAQALRAPGVQTALAALMLGQVVMIAVMVMTPLEMRDHLGHSLDEISLVIAAHVTGMYATSIVTGRVADRVGHARTILIGAVFLIVACLLAPFANDLLRLSFALFLLGVGWNFSFVAGSSLLTDSLRPGERARIQGTSDLLVGLVGAVSSLTSGLAFDRVGYTGIALAGVSLALVLLIVALLARLPRAVPVPSAPPGGT